MKQDLTITAKLRQTRGKNEARRLRVQGLTPAILYGAGQESVAVAVNPKEVSKILHSGSGANTIFNLAVDGSSTPVMIVDHQNDPVRDNLLHVDLKRIDLTKLIEVTRTGILTSMSLVRSIRCRSKCSQLSDAR